MNLYQKCLKKKWLSLIEILLDRTIDRETFVLRYERLYSQGEIGYVAFQRYLLVHSSPRVLGGVNNINFKITTRDPVTFRETNKHPVVLKIETPFQSPLGPQFNTVNHLKSEGVDQMFTSVACDMDVNLDEQSVCDVLIYPFVNSSSFASIRAFKN